MTSTRVARREPHSPRREASAAARERAKEVVRAQLRAVARRHVAERGAVDLSLRAVAREMHMTSSAIYRYVSSRDDLLTSLVEESFESVSEVAERADRVQAGAGGDAAARWLAVCRDTRMWALDHPHEYALIYGPPIPGYPVPAETLPAGRIWRVIVGIMDAAVVTGALRPPVRPFTIDGLISEHLSILMSRPTPPFTDFFVRAMALFSGLIGAISADLFGHFHDLTIDPDRAFDLVMATGAQGVGLDLPVAGRSEPAGD